MFKVAWNPAWCPGRWQPRQGRIIRLEFGCALVVAAHEAEPGIFYAAVARDLYRSPDAGLTWERLDVAWPHRYRDQAVHALAVSED